MTHVIVLRGPFTEGDVGEIIALVQRIEADRPDETFEIALNASDSADAEELLDHLNPLRPGYQRVVKYWNRGQ